MQLVRKGDGVITLEGVPIKEWFEAAGVRPAQDRYRGFLDGKCCMCLLTSLGYAALGHDADALYTAMNGKGGVSQGQPRTSAILAAVIGIPHREARALEDGWTDDMLSRALLAARNEDAIERLWHLGHDAWVQATSEGGRRAHG